MNFGKPPHCLPLKLRAQMKQLHLPRVRMWGVREHCECGSMGKVWQNNVGMNHSPVAQHAAVLRKQWEEEGNPLIQPFLALCHVPYCRTHYPGFCGPCWQLLFMTQPPKSSRLLWNYFPRAFSMGTFDFFIRSKCVSQKSPLNCSASPLLPREGDSHPKRMVWYQACY